MDRRLSKSTVTLATREHLDGWNDRGAKTFSEGDKETDNRAKSYLRLHLDNLRTGATSGYPTSRSTLTMKTDASRADTRTMTSHGFGNIESRGSNLLNDLYRRFVRPVEKQRRSEKIVAEKLHKGRLTEEQQRWIEEEKQIMEKEQELSDRGHKVTELEKLELRANQVSNLFF